MMPPLRHALRRLLNIGLLCTAAVLTSVSHASVGDCLKAALNTASPQDLERAAAFATSHPTCLSNLAPPYVVPYAALSGSLDFANQSGALKPLGLAFGDRYEVCVEKTDPAKTALNKLAPILKPVCGTLNLNCTLFEGAASEQANAQLSQQFPMLAMMPCACAAATSHLGVQKIIDTLNTVKGCGATLAEAGKALGDAAKGTYNLGSKTAEGAKDAAEDAAEITSKAFGSLVNGATGAVGEVGCTVLNALGLCDKSAPPPPPTAASIANSWCAPRGGIAQLNSSSGKPNDFSLTCNDGTLCKVEPNQAPSCITGEQIAAKKAALLQKNAEMENTNKLWCTARSKQFKDGYNALCRDGACKLGVFLVSADFGAKCQNINAQAQPEFHILSEVWAYKGEAPYIAKYEVLIAESIRRDPKASVHESMSAWGCKSFLGRIENRLCSTQQGFDLCKQAVQQGKLSTCRLAGTQLIYPDPNKLKLPIQLLETPASQPAAAGDLPATPPSRITPPTGTLKRNLKVVPALPETPASNPESLPTPKVLRLKNQVAP